MEGKGNPPACPICGAAVSPGQKTCPSCGFDFDRSVQKASPPLKGNPPVPPVAGSSVKKKPFPVWGWILIIAGGLGCIGAVVLIILVAAGILLLGPSGKTTITSSITAVPEIFQSGPDEAAPPEPQEQNGFSFTINTQIPEEKALPVEILDVWFKQNPDMPTYMPYGFILKNPNKAVTLQNITLQAVAYDADGGILATGNSYVSLILPGEELGFSGAGGLSIPENSMVAKLDVTVTDEGDPVSSPVEKNPFSFEKVTFYPDEYSPTVTAILKNSEAAGFDNIIVTAVAYDKGGTIIGGSVTYSSYYIAAHRELPVMLLIEADGQVETIKLYAAFGGGTHIYEEEETDLPQVLDYGIRLDDYGTLQYVVLVESKSSGRIFQYLPFVMGFYGKDGEVLGVASNQITSIFPGEKQALSGSTSLAYVHSDYKIDRVEFYPARPYDDYDPAGLTNAKITSNPLSVDQVKAFPGDYQTKVTAMLHNSSDQKIQGRVVAVLFDDQGKIIAGGEGYPPAVQGNGEVAVEINIYPVVEAARVEVFVTVSNVER